MHPPCWMMCQLQPFSLRGASDEQHRHRRNSHWHLHHRPGPQPNRVRRPTRDGHQGPRLVQRVRGFGPLRCRESGQVARRADHPGSQHRHPQRRPRRSPAEQRLLRHGRPTPRSPSRRPASSMSTRIISGSLATSPSRASPSRSRSTSSTRATPSTRSAISGSASKARRRSTARTGVSTGTPRSKRAACSSAKR